MSTQTDEQRAADEPVEYGNFQTTKLPGLGRLGAVGTLVLLIGVVVLMLLLIFSFIAAVVWAVLLVLALLPAVIPAKQGENRYDRIVARARYRQARASGAAELRQGLTGHVPDGQIRLPGMGAAR